MIETEPEAVVREYYQTVDDERYDDLVELFTEDVSVADGDEPALSRFTPFE